MATRKPAASRSAPEQQQQQPQAQLNPPAIGAPWPGQGGIYIGIARALGDQPAHHLILALEAPPKRLNWADATAWAAQVRADGHADFSLPTRFESALLYANANERFGAGWHWTSTQYSADTAWYQDFGDGYQNLNDEESEGRARAVRRLIA